MHCCSEVENKCADQVRAVQAQLDGERDLLLSETSKQRLRLEQQIENMKEEEVRLKERLTASQQVQPCSPLRINFLK